MSLSFIGISVSESESASILQKKTWAVDRQPSFREFIRELAIELRHRPKRSKSRSHSIGERNTVSSDWKTTNLCIFQETREHWRRRAGRCRGREARRARTPPRCSRPSTRSGAKCKYQQMFSFLAPIQRDQCNVQRRRLFFYIKQMPF